MLLLLFPTFVIVREKYGKVKMLHLQWSVNQNTVRTVCLNVRLNKVVVVVVFFLDYRCKKCYNIVWRIPTEAMVLWNPVLLARWSGKQGQAHELVKVDCMEKCVSQEICTVDLYTVSCMKEAPMLKFANKRKDKLTRRTDGQIKVDSRERSTRGMKFSCFSLVCVALVTTPSRELKHYLILIVKRNLLIK